MINIEPVAAAGAPLARRNPVAKLAAALVFSVILTLICCYYGFTATGGSVGVGRNTAKSMMLNMVLIHIVGVLGTQLFWGLSPNAPIAN